MSSASRLRRPRYRELILTSLSVVAALAGIYIASKLYLKAWEGPLYRALLNKWYVDEVYDFLFVNGVAKGGGTAAGALRCRGRGWRRERRRLVEAAPSLPLSIWWDTWIVDGAVRFTVLQRQAALAIRCACYRRDMCILRAGLCRRRARIFWLLHVAVAYDRPLTSLGFSSRR